MPSLRPLQHRLDRIAAAFRTPRGRAVLRAGRWMLVAGVVAWLAYQLSDIGWRDVWASRPRTPWFYVLWLLMYLQLPIVEGFLYRWLWDAPLRSSMGPILRKRALNQDVVSYSGEAYFFAWARRRLGLSDRVLFGTLKDNAIASGLATWTAALLLLGGFLLTGQIVLTELLPEASGVYVAAGLALAAGGVAVGLRFRRTLLTLPARTVLVLFAVHVGRFLVIAYALQILQWWIVLPEAPLEVWATMLAVITIVNRLPLLPAKDLVGIGAVLGMTDLLAASASTIAAMLLMRSALDKAANVALFGGTLLLNRHAPPEDAPAAAPAERAAAAAARTVET